MVSEVTSETGATWYDLSDPTAEELATLAREVGLSPADAEFVVQDHHRPEVAVRESYLMVLVQVPTFDKKTRVTRGVPLYLIITRDTLWTVHHEQLIVTSQLLDEFGTVPEKREEYFADGPVAVGLHIISDVLQTAQQKLDRLAKHIAIAEDAVFHGNERKMVEEISYLMRDVLDFRAIIRPHLQLFTPAPHHALLEEAAEARQQWERHGGTAAKLWEQLEGLLESVTELRDTNDSLAQHKENQLLRLLTYYSAISIPIFILINPLNPFSGESTTFEMIIFWGMFGLFGLLLILLFWYFRRKRVL